MMSLLSGTVRSLNMYISDPHFTKSFFQCTQIYRCKIDIFTSVNAIFTACMSIKPQKFVKIGILGMQIFEMLGSESVGYLLPG